MSRPSLPGDVRQSVPGDVRQSAPGDVRQSAPGDVRQSAPGDVRQSCPKIQASDLRDIASEERVERIWGRLSSEVEALHVRPASRPSRAAVWAVAATFAAFGTGLVAGRMVWQAPPVAPSPVVATHDRASVDLFAAGSQERSYTLPGGGTITLAPGSMIELERSGGSDVRLRLLSGEASLDAGEAGDRALAIVSGEAVVATAPGSMIRVQKRADNLDVRVIGGSAHVSSPAGTHALSKGEQVDDVPTRRTATSVTTPPVVRVAPTATTARVARGEPSSTAAVAVAPSWRELHAANKWDEATEALKQQSGSFSAAVTGAGSAKELMDIGDLASWQGRDPQAAIVAFHKVADQFHGSTYAAIAAKKLATHYAASQPDLAKKYLDQAAQKSVFSEDAMCAQMRAEHQAGHKDEASARASEYLGKHPNGRCKDDANRILAGGDADDGDETAPDDAAPAPSGSASASTSSAAPATKP